MNLSRRDILKGAVATLVTGASSLAIAPALASSRSAAATATSPATGVAELSRESFAGAVGSDFEVHVGAIQTVTVRLESVTNLVTPRGGPAPARGKEGFSLLFTGAGKHRFPQGTYTIDHPRLGSFVLLLVVVAQAGSVTSYEAVINRLWP